MELKDFLKLASKKERAEVAIACNDSVSYLYQIAGNHRYASPILAFQIERETRRVAKTSNGRLEVVPRATMVRHPEIFLEPGCGSLSRQLNGDVHDDSC
ncbi:hypothetical protein [Pseudomaricurvus alkylphenolicus]|uniref:hypothetical protein n=1 Tax=Pseudomaricurvus alkylphenolicus TaxID=1306991 RepID=UPI001980B97B|nr:hypothetical protein [Pseudomaricurvus alkylphenolicus]